jgi:hypothetical protein
MQVTSAGPRQVVSEFARLREAAADLDTALVFTNVPGLFSAGSGWLRDLCRDLEVPAGPIGRPTAAARRVCPGGRG